ncbi:MAG: TlpA family protein disulfide reductase [Chloroflexi bacterium]|nr:TlpA family protein disulfide reductase [Chloroflexota bacterium]
MGARQRRPIRSSPARKAGIPRSSTGRKAGIALALVALGLVAAFALTQAGPGTAGTQASRGTAGRDEPLAPDIAAPLIDGGRFELATERGRPVLVLFTASWCAPCIPEVNKMAQLHEEFASRGLRQLVLSVDPGDTRETFDGLRERTRGGRLLWALDPDQRATRAYRITATDTKVLIDASGRIAFTAVGPTDLGVLRREVEKAFP